MRSPRGGYESGTESPKPPKPPTGPGPGGERPGIYAPMDDVERAGMVPVPPDATDELRSEVKHLLNSHSRENVSNTPDFMLADVMIAALVAFEEASKQREAWYGQALSITTHPTPDNDATEQPLPPAESDANDAP